LRIGKDIEEREVVTLFGIYVHNGYKYCHNENHVLIVKVETVCMIMHQRTHVPNIQRINKVEAQWITYEIKTCKKVN
jgi:hypothetical protein